jgi:uncharacterized protein YecA (UPF0149 family)
MQVTQHPQTLELRREFFTGDTKRDIMQAMDDRAVELGERVVKRSKIGRNASCPCASGRKFKKCCMAGARRISSR